MQMRHFRNHDRTESRDYAYQHSRQFRGSGIVAHRCRPGDESEHNRVQIHVNTGNEVQDEDAEGRTEMPENIQFLQTERLAADVLPEAEKVEDVVPGRNQHGVEGIKHQVVTGTDENEKAYSGYGLDYEIPDGYVAEFFHPLVKPFAADDGKEQLETEQQEKRDVRPDFSDSQTQHCHYGITGQRKQKVEQKYLHGCFCLSGSIVPDTGYLPDCIQGDAYACKKRDVGNDGREKLYLPDTVSQQDDRTYYNVPVVMEGESILNEDNLMITSRSTSTVSVHLSGPRGELNKITNSNSLTVKADLSKITEPGDDIALAYTVVYPSNVNGSSLTEESRNPQAIYVDVDYRRTKEIPVQVSWTGSRSEDYIYDTENAVLDNPTITVAGPAAVVDQIDHAQIEVDLSEQVKSISQSYRYTLCDAAGEPVDAQQIVTSVEEVRLDMQIQRIKELDLVVDVVYGGGATASNTEITLSQETLRVSGGEAVLSELGDSFTVCTINLADVERSSTELTFPINLPEGVTNQTGVSELTVKIRISDVMTKEVTIENFRVVNVPEGLSAEIITASLTVKVRGPADEITSLEEEDIVAEADFTNAEVGTATYRVVVIFPEGFEDVGALKTNSVTAMVQAGE